MRKYIKTLQQVAKNRRKDTETEMNTKVTLAIENINEMKRTVENVVYIFKEILKYHTFESLDIYDRKSRK